MKRELTGALVVVAALGMLGACGDDQDETEFPTGKTISVNATSTEDGYIEYGSDDTYVGIDGTGDVFTEGTYTVEGDEITFETDSYCEAVAPATTPVTYTFEWDGNVLTFVENPDDTCADRADTLVGDWQLATD
jgi:hypothetical protein